ncbi:GrpE nucleotide exchange factor [Dillenia turbinata]|uniref:GrpE protein homolog n=1 Tax=Dillenia turbinata TaxID=194707 RepID=A0AAN8ZG66_9MAGN
MITTNPISLRPSSMAFSLPSSSSSSSSSPSISSNNVHSANSEEDSHSEDKANVPSLKALVEAYKDAILSGDAVTVSDIEAMIYGVEKEKNELVQKVSVLSAEITSGKEKFIRLQADFDNYRKRVEKEKLTVMSDAQGEVIEALLPMVDNFERAKQQLRPETENEKKIDTSYQGIYKQFVEIMRSLHVAAVATIGKPFDPAMHEAIAREESQEHKEGVIIEEFRRGFLLGDRLLRPAMVKVSAGPGRKKASVHNETATGQPATAAGMVRFWREGLWEEEEEEEETEEQEVWKE